jgi:hypothetical protein
MIYSGILILLNAYKCVNVVCTGAAHCSLERLVEEHFWSWRSRCNLAPPVEENLAPQVYNALPAPFAAPKYAATVGDALVF